MSAEDLSLKPSVLLSFRMENTRSFKDGAELSMLATAVAEKACVRDVPWRESGGSSLRVLPVAAVFGANASGKSNLLEAMADMRRHVLGSFRHRDPSGGVPRQPFRLDGHSAGLPSRYEIDIVLAGVRHAYGFAVDDDRVAEEWAYRYPKGRAARLFHRQGDDILLGAAERSRGREVVKLLRPNALFLSTAAMAGHPLLLPLYDWFHDNLQLIKGRSPHRRMATMRMLEDDTRREAVMGLLQAADLGITDARTHRMNQTMRDRFRRAMSIIQKGTGHTRGHDTGTTLQHGDATTNDHDTTTDNSDATTADHNTTTDNGGANSIEDDTTTDNGDTISTDGEYIECTTWVNLVHRGADGDVELDQADESSGTLVWFELLGMVIQSLTAGTVVLVDELDASLHPELVAHLVQLYQDPQTNPAHAQIVFNSHDTTLLGHTVGERLLGRDQIWFTDKLNDGRSEIYPLTRFDPRKKEALSRRYMQGWYGAKPITSSGDFQSAIETAIPKSGQRNTSKSDQRNTDDITSKHSTANA